MPETVPMFSWPRPIPAGLLETCVQLSRARSKAAASGVLVVFVRLNMGIMMAR